MYESNAQAAADGFTLADVSGFLARSWKWIVGGAVAGGLLVAAYIVLVPHKYGASAVVRMAQMPARSAGGTYNKVNVQEPALLVDELSQPSIYPPEVLAACGVQNQRAPGENLLRRLTFAARDGDVLAMTARADSPAIAQACITALVGLIRSLQAAESKPTIDALRQRLGDLQSRMADSRAYTASLEKSANSQIAYLAARDDLSYLRTHLDEVNNALRLQADARTLAPVYVPQEPVFPRRPVPLAVIGIVVGALAGLLLAGLRHAR